MFWICFHSQASTDMEEIFTFIDNLNKRLARNITDLDDVRSSMAALSEIRESEIKYVCWSEFICYFVHLSRSFVRLFVLSSIHPRVRLSIHLCIHSFVRSFVFFPSSVHSFVHLFIHTFFRSFIHTLFHSFILFIHSFIHAFNNSFIHLLIHSYNHSFGHSFTNLFIDNSFFPLLVTRWLIYSFITFVLYSIHSLMLFP